MAIPLNSSTLVTVFGGSGFVGRYVVQALANTGCRVRVAVRRPSGAIYLQPLGSVGQIHAVQANLRDEASVRRAIEGVDGVVNLVGILRSSGKQTFESIQAKGAGLIAQSSPGSRHPGRRSRLGDSAQAGRVGRPMRGPRPKAKSAPEMPFPTRRSSAPRSSSVQRTNSSTVSHRWRVSRRSCL